MLILSLIIIIILEIKKENHNDIAINFKSDIDNRFYTVKNDKLKYNTANILASIRQKIITLSEYLYKFKNTKFRKYKTRIEFLYEQIYKTNFLDNLDNPDIISTTINKGDSIVLCVRNKKIKKLYSLNLLMYVALHELSHIISPTYTINNIHDDIFKEIFHIVAKLAIKLGIYKKINFSKYPVKYCGLLINNSII